MGLLEHPFQNKMTQLIKKYFGLMVFPGAMLVLAAILLAAGHPISLLEFLGVILSLAGYVLIGRQVAPGYLSLMASQIILAVHFHLEKSAFGAIGFALLGAVISLVSFVNWTRPRKNKGAELKPSFLNNWWLAPIFAVAAAIVYYRWGTGFIGEIEWLAPYFSLLGYVLLGNKRIQGWIFFVLSITVMAVLMVPIDAYLLLGRNLMYMVIGTMSFIKWRRQIRQA